MANRIWRFSSVPHQPSPDAVAYLWQWRVGVDGAVVSRSPKFFHTLDECVRDAQRNGFNGQVNSGSATFRRSGYRMESIEGGKPTA
jgi:hypothetical protein